MKRSPPEQTLAGMLVFLLAGCGSSVSLPTTESPALKAPTVEALRSFSVRCVPETQLPPVKDYRGVATFSGGNRQLVLSVSSRAPEDVPSVRIKNEDASPVCVVEFERSCVGTGASGRPERYTRTEGLTLDFVRDRAGDRHPIARYRTRVQGYGDGVKAKFSTGYPEICSEEVDWIWLAGKTPQLLAAPEVGRSNLECESRLEARVQGGLYCLTPSTGKKPVCPGTDLKPGCYLIDGDRLVPTDEAPDDSAALSAHPWLDKSRLPYPTPSVAKAAVELVRADIIKCLRPHQRLSVHYFFGGDGSATAREQQASPPLKVKQEKCLQSAISHISHDPFYGKLTFSASYP